MMIHWRAHLNAVQNAVGYMIKPTMAMMFASPIGLQTVTLDSATVVQPTISTSVPTPSITASVTQPTLSGVTVTNDIM